MLLKIKVRIDLVFDHILPVADNGALGSQQIPFGLGHSCNVGMDELGLLPAGKPDLDAFLIGIGDIMPDALLECADNRFDTLRNQAHDPVEVMTAPIVSQAA